MEPEGTLQCLHLSVIGQCPEPDESNPDPHTSVSFRSDLAFSRGRGSVVG
jgi:hypothetical protein